MFGSNKYTIVLSVLVLLSGCSKGEKGSINSEKKAIEIEQPLVNTPEVVPEEKSTDYEIIYNVVNKDLFLTSNTIIEGDAIIFNQGIKIVTNGYELRVLADSVEFLNNSIDSYNTGSSPCNVNGESSRSVYIQADVIKGKVSFNLRGRHAGDYCMGNLDKESIFCSKIPKFRHKNCVYYVEDIKGLSGGDAGFIYLEEGVNLNELNLFVSSRIGHGSRSLRFGSPLGWSGAIRAGSDGRRTKVCFKEKDDSSCKIHSRKHNNVDGTISNEWN